MNMMGIIFSNIYDEYMGQLTKDRTMASLPFGGRYRAIDFILSDMVNSKVDTVSVITKSNYQSLMDHLGNGAEWDLSRKRGGLFIMPPFGAGQSDVYKGKIEALWGTVKFLERSTQEYVVLADTRVIYNIDFDKVLKEHIKNNADITIVTQKQKIESKLDNKEIVVKVNSENKVVDVMVNYSSPGLVLSGLGSYIMKRELLLKLIYEAMSYNLVDFEKDIIQRKYDILNIYSFEFERQTLALNSIADYFNANMMLLNKEVRDEIFNKERPIYTKIKDEVPTLYQDDSNVTNSLIADGCIISGTVENSILFRGVKVKKGAVVRNCIIMQDTDIGDDSELNYVICDKEVKISDSKTLIGAKEYPVIINKGKIV